MSFCHAQLVCIFSARPVTNLTENCRCKSLDIFIYLSNIWMDTKRLISIMKFSLALNVDHLDKIHAYLLLI